jgi:hypothetical protein
MIFCNSEPQVRDISLSGRESKKSRESESRASRERERLTATQRDFI